MKDIIICIFGVLAFVTFMSLPALVELIVFGSVSAGALQ